MPTENTARTQMPSSDAPDEGDYQALYSTLSASARGRAFLAEYARRNASSDADAMQSALRRLQTLAAPDDVPEPATGRIRHELYALRASIRETQAELDASIAKAEKLKALVGLVERQIADMAAQAGIAPQGEARLPDLSAPPIEETERRHLAVVPSPEQPELPIPSPATTQPPSIALVRSDTMIAEVAFVDLPAALAAQDVEPSPSKVVSARPPADPLASIMALSEEERLALFT
jgi:hypothetical protein